MPLSKKRMRERKQRDRSNLNRVDNGSPQSIIKPLKEESNSKVRTDVGVKLNKVGLTLQGNPKSSISGIPVYNPAIHKAGDRVIMYRGGRMVVSIVPQVDISGQEVPEYW